MCYSPGPGFEVVKKVFKYFIKCQTKKNVTHFFLIYENFNREINKKLSIDDFLGKW